MPRKSYPWWRSARNAWFVQINGRKINLGPDKEEAFRRYYALMAEPRTGKVVSSDTVAAITDQFLTWTKKHRASQTFDWYEKRVQPFCEAVKGLLVSEIRPYHLQEWLDAHDWSDGHKNGVVRAVMRVLNWANQLGYIENNPMPKFPNRPQPGRRDEIVTTEEHNKILEHTQDQQFADLLTVAYECGPRPQELLRVEARHVNVNESCWVFPRTEAKVKKFPRHVFLTDKALEITKRLMLKCPEGPIFKNTKNKAWNPYSVNCRFNRLKAKIGKKVCLYTYRHTWCTRALASGLDSLTVSVLMGHADPTMVQRVYQHLEKSPDFLREQLRRVG